jgi:hypothetical protein
VLATPSMPHCDSCQCTRFYRAELCHFPADLITTLKLLAAGPRRLPEPHSCGVCLKVKEARLQVCSLWPPGSHCGRVTHWAWPLVSGDPRLLCCAVCLPPSPPPLCPPPRWFFQQLVLTMEYFHRRNIAHRDIKLENTLLKVKPIVTITVAAGSVPLWNVSYIHHGHLTPRKQRVTNVWCMPSCQYVSQIGAGMPLHHPHSSMRILCHMITLKYISNLRLMAGHGCVHVHACRRWMPYPVPSSKWLTSVSASTTHHSPSHEW